MKDINDLLQERGNLVDQMKAISAKNPEGFSDEVQAEYAALDVRQEAVKASADRLHKEEQIAHELATAPKAQKIALEQKFEGKPINSPEYVKALNAHIRTGKYSNALEVGTDSEGGHLVSDAFDMMFREIRDDYNPLRAYFDVITSTGDHNIRVESTLGVSAWTAEEGTVSEAAPAFGNVALLAHKLTRLVKVSQELLQDSDFGIEAYLASAIGRSHGLAEEAAFIGGLGAGSNQPTGLMAGAGAAATSETAITEEALLDLFYGLNRVYRSNATWIFSDASVRVIRGIENGSGDKIWQPSLVAGVPDAIMGRPYLTSVYMGDAAASPQEVVGIFGDLKNYTVADRTGLSVQRLDELYATTGQVGFQAWSRTDGKVVQAAGIKKLTLAAS